MRKVTLVPAPTFWRAEMPDRSMGLKDAPLLVLEG